LVGFLWLILCGRGRETTTVIHVLGGKLAMKFAHEFKVLSLYIISAEKYADNDKEALRKEGFPLNWVESAIPYSQLKKCIRKVESELSELGLDADTLGHLTSSTKDHASRSPRRNIRDAPVALHYDFTGMDFV
jgi:hypothetical protein